MGRWDHVRGNDTFDDGRLKMGRDGWFAETMSFYDQYLKGVQPTVDYPAFAIQDSTGAWRAQQEWPVADRTATIGLGGGRYLEDGGADAYAALLEAGLPVPPPPGAGDPAEGDPAEGAGGLEPIIPKELAALQAERIRAGLTTSAMYKFSEPVAKARRVTGTPQAIVAAEGRGNVMVKLYDVAPDGKAVIINEQVSLLRQRGRTVLDPFQAKYLERHQVNLTAALPASFRVPAARR